MLPWPIVGSAVDGCELPVGPPVGRFTGCSLWAYANSERGLNTEAKCKLCLSELTEVACRLGVCVDR